MGSKQTKPEPTPLTIIPDMGISKQKIRENITGDVWADLAFLFNNRISIAYEDRTFSYNGKPSVCVFYTGSSYDIDTLKLIYIIADIDVSAIKQHFGLKISRLYDPNENYIAVINYKNKNMAKFNLVADKFKYGQTMEIIKYYFQKISPIVVKFKNEAAGPEYIYF